MIPTNFKDKICNDDYGKISTSTKAWDVLRPRRHDNFRVHRVLKYMEMAWEEAIMDKDELNQKLHEALGYCWHEWGSITVDCETLYQCKKCGVEAGGPVHRKPQRSLWDA
jgi:hypothetical protein